MTKWKTNLHVNYSEGSIICENVDINSGIFQGDSLSHCHCQFQCYKLELRRNKADGQEDTKANDLEYDASHKSRP